MRGNNLASAKPARIAASTCSGLSGLTAATASSTSANQSPGNGSSITLVAL